jgi:hypothetical protein
LVDEINLDPRTKVRLKNIEIELLEGNANEKPWLIQDNLDKKYILLEEEQYNKILELLKFSLKENLELKLNQRIMEELPLDLEDVKAVVKQKIEDENLSVDEAIKKVKNENKNLFHNITFEEIFDFVG